jgi:uncharacterized membrane protein YfcA
MDFILIGAVAFLASALTFFSGFGLGTLLLPAFALFLPAAPAVAATAIVHLLNGLFKGTLVFRMAHWPTVLRFGLFAVPGAIAGALILSLLDDRVAGTVIGAALIVFGALELTPWFRKLKAPDGLMPIGGAVTGLFGGLTGQQGALRSIFLLRTNLDGPQFIATGTLVSILIDLARVPTYFATFTATSLNFDARAIGLIATGAAAAFAGAWLGSRYLATSKIEVVRLLVAGLLFVIGGALVLGYI